MTHFPPLSDHRTNASFEGYHRLISNLIDEFNRRIKEMNSFLPMMKMFANPIAVNVTSALDNFQLELLGMQSDIELKQLFQSEDLLKFWSRVPDGKYPNLKTNAQKTPLYLDQRTYVRRFSVEWPKSKINATID